MTFVYMMIMMDNVVEKEDVKDFGHNNNGVEDVLKSTTTSTKMTKKSFFCITSIIRGYYHR